jgi:putative PIG3 family NAD(P)H quinone oxidoreductase
LDAAKDWEIKEMRTLAELPLPPTQRAMTITAAGGPEVLQLTTVEVASPDEGEVLIEVHAAGVNRHDCRQRQGGPAHARTAVPGLEVAGTVVAVGPDISSALLGQRVCALVDGGGYAEYAIAAAPLVLPIPEGFDEVLAAGLPEALFTTWYNLFELGGLYRPQLTLIHGGTSGVGSLAIQALSALGYRVFATCGSDEKCQAAAAFGAAAVFNYNAHDLAAQILSASEGRTVDLILDMSGGAHIEHDIEVLTPGGRIIELSGGTGKPLSIPLVKMMAKQAWITGALLRPTSLARKAAIARRLHDEIWPELGPRVRPVIAETFPLDHAAQAHAAMERGQHIGKIILTVR